MSLPLPQCSGPQHVLPWPDPPNYDTKNLLRSLAALHLRWSRFFNYTWGGSIFDHTCEMAGQQKESQSYLRAKFYSLVGSALTTFQHEFVCLKSCILIEGINWSHYFYLLECHTLPAQSRWWSGASGRGETESNLTIRSSEINKSTSWWISESTARSDELANFEWHVLYSQKSWNSNQRSGNWLLFGNCETWGKM